MALNAPIQGTSADIIKLAMVHIDSYLQKTKKLSSHVRLILQVHDEIIFEVHNDVHDEFKKKAQELMEQVLDNSYLEIDTNIPLVVHTSSGKNWSELK